MTGVQTCALPISWVEHVRASGYPTTTLVRELRRRGGKFGIATMCVGVGQGLATVFEAV